MKYNADSIDRTMLREVYDDSSLLASSTYKLRTPYEDLYYFCKYQRHASFDEFFDLYLIRKSVWKDMDEFDSHMNSFFFRFFYRFSDFYKDQRRLLKAASRYWNHTSTRDVVTGTKMYYDISKKYPAAEQFSVFSRLVLWNGIYCKEC